MSRTLNPHHRYTAGLCIAAIHMFYLLYLHFAYHTMAESIFLKSEFFISLF